MTRLHDAFDVLVDRGDPAGSDILLARARDALARGAVAELQPSDPGNRRRLRVVIAAALCVAVVAGIALVSRAGTTPPANRRPTPILCRVAVSDRRAKVVLQAVRNARTSVSVGAYTFRFAIAEGSELTGVPERVRDDKQLYLKVRALGPGLGSSGFWSASGMPQVGKGPSTGTANIKGGPITYACER